MLISIIIILLCVVVTSIIIYEWREIENWIQNLILDTLHSSSKKYSNSNLNIGLRKYIGGI